MAEYTLNDCPIFWDQLKVQSNNDGEVKAPYFLALEMMPKGGQLDLYFVPVKTGTFEVFCTIAGHKERGMAGTLTIQ